MYGMTDHAETDFWLRYLNQRGQTIQEFIQEVTQGEMTPIDELWDED